MTDIIGVDLSPLVRKRLGEFMSVVSSVTMSQGERAMVSRACRNIEAAIRTQAPSVEQMKLLLARAYGLRLLGGAYNQTREQEVAYALQYLADHEESVEFSRCREILAMEADDPPEKKDRRRLAKPLGLLCKCGGEIAAHIKGFISADECARRIADKEAQ